MKAAILLVLLWFCHNLAAAQPTILYGNNPAAGHYQLLRGVKLYYETYGQGLPLLLIHGNGDNISAFAKNIPYFAQRYRVIAVDSRAHGKSVDPGDSLSFEMMADDFASLLTSLRIDSAYVLGWSDGGINALVLALRHPEKVKRLVATGANIWPDSTALMPNLWKQQQRGYQENRNTKFTDPKRRNDWKVFCLDVFQPNIPLAALRRVRVPAFIVAGDRDVIRPEHTVAIYQNLPRAWLWIIPNSGHATLQEHADEFNQKTDAFFRTKAVPAPAR
ncbi:alpha/beta hydrolase [Microvirga sp. STS02]|uniref:alpha/beta fold hydrolase n=1 Tax=Hymenobacter negativus TaxID=2795026 RepID=UPI0018DE0DCC|nr:MULTISPECIES: alpha/beta hydrolase [Bacteria]MBH8567474.1 alpha/beta hydrolase [Hymenobacter negativus]MBR7207206.1 alpha/beta hydrolase [Microvirga sp. STS02]